jgi:hypothetical protein
MKIFTNFTCAAILIVITGCHFDKKPEIKLPMNRNKLQYSSVIFQIDNRLSSPGTWEELFLDSNFIYLYENSAKYLDSAIKFISNNKYSDHQKAICIFSMQKANIESYLIFLDACTTLFENNNLSEDLLLKGINPAFGKKRPIVKNYNNKNERKLLEKMQNVRNISKQFNIIIREILSGNLYKQMREFYLQSGYDVESL